MIKVGALWNKKSEKSGEEYLQGKFGDAILQVFQNNYKETENQPDFIVYLSEAKKPEGGYAKKGNGGYQKKPFNRGGYQKSAPEQEDNEAL